MDKVTGTSMIYQAVAITWLTENQTELTTRLQPQYRWSFVFQECQLKQYRGKGMEHWYNGY